MNMSPRRHFDFAQSGLVMIGIGLGAIFWILESALHIVVFQQDNFIQQIYRLESHEIWMRLAIVGLFVAFGIYAQRIVNARRKAEEAAKLANIELAQIFETAADGMRVVDRNFNVVRINKTFSALSGMHKEEVIGKKCYDVFRGPLCETPGCPLTRILSNEERVECDSEKVRHDGVKVSCIVTATPFRAPNGELIGIVEDFKDISDRKRSEKELVESRKRLQNLTSHLQFVREEERERIAREIHDELGQALTALKMDVHWLGNKLSKGENLLIDKANSMSKLIDTTIRSVKRICSELRPGLLDDFGLSAAIEWQAADFEKRTGIRCEIMSDPEDIILDHDRSTAIFRVFQETLTNIARHANATMAKVVVKENLDAIEMEIRDNGKGITEKEILNSKSFGLIGMRERVYSFGGDFAVCGSRNMGTTVRVRIPTKNEEAVDDKNSHRG